VGHRLRELIASRVPSVEHIRFTNSGSEAVMMALKAARAYTGRPKIAKFEGCYHGSYDFAEISLASSPENWGADDPTSTAYSWGTPKSVLEDVIVLKFNDIENTERLIEAHKDQLAAVLVDPMPMRAGLIPADDGFIQRLREITKQYGIVLIFDEVVSLRVASGGVQSLLGITPDLTTMAKIIGGGFPVGAVGGSAAVMSVFDPSEHYPLAPHGGTFNANPVTMAAGLVAMEKLTPVEFDRLDRLGDMAREGIAEAMDGARVPGQVTGMGSLFHIHFHDRPLSDYRSTQLTDAEQLKVKKVHRELVGRGVFIPGFLVGNLSTPMSEGEVSAFVGAFADALEAAD
jgi:glutamate-1-semialdehyde 2,1-aminomutase